MKITDVTTTLIYNPEADAIQDATIPPAQTRHPRTHHRLHPHPHRRRHPRLQLPELPRRHPIPHQRQPQRHPHRQNPIRDRTHLDRDVLARPRLRTQRLRIPSHLRPRRRTLGPQRQSPRRSPCTNCSDKPTKPSPATAAAVGPTTPSTNWSPSRPDTSTWASPASR